MGNTPNVRFKGFTEDWEQRKLGEIITEYKETVDSECTLPILTSSKTEGVILQEEHFGRKQQHDITGYNILPRNYCTYRNRSDGVDFTFNINKCCDKGIISKFYPVFSGKNSDVLFLSLVLNNSDEVVREIAYTCTGTGQKVLSFLDLQKMKVRVPSYDEQKEIAAYFENLDHLITLHQQKCDETKEFKKYMLQNMFPQKDEKVPKIRFAGFTGDWEQRKFDDLADYKKGPFGSALKKDMFVPKSDMTVKVYEQQNAINKDWHLERYFITEEYANKLSGFRVEGGDIIVSCAGTIGETYEIPLNAEPGIINQALMRIKVKESIVNKKMFNILFTNMIDDFTRVHSNGSAIKNIPPFSDLKPMVVFVPKMDEQNKISSYFSNLDHLITLHQQKCAALKEFKKYMLQNMFPQKGENKCQN